LQGDTVKLRVPLFLQVLQFEKVAFVKMSFKKVTHVIFDMDGLLIESESAYDKVINEMAQPFGKTYTKDIRIKILGTPEIDTAKIAIREMQLPYTVDKFLEIYRGKVKAELQHPPLMPGIYLLFL
jgi:pseudouridine-5'-monophosphatase